MGEPARKEDMLVTLRVADLEAIVLRSVKAAMALAAPEAKEVLGFKDACELLDASAPTVRRWTREEGLPYIRLGGRTGGKILKFRRSEVLAWLDNRRTEG
jgi:excisionase family DNA binding protein